jgi:hypothetical protein
MTMTIDQTTPTQPRTQRFYCKGCQEWHETPRLLDAVREEAERIRLEKGTVNNELGD